MNSTNETQSSPPDLWTQINDKMAIVIGLLMVTLNLLLMFFYVAVKDLRVMKEMFMIAGLAFADFIKGKTKCKIQKILILPVHFRCGILVGHTLAATNEL